MAFRYLDIQRDGVVERVTLNRPDVRNAFNEEVVADLQAWADAARDDRDLRVAVLGGAGPVFCAGGDLAWMTRVAGYSREENLRDADRMARMFESLDTLPAPLIGRVHGAALGGGCGLAAVCDIVIAEEGTAFGFTEVRLGLSPSVIAPFVIAKIGRSAARDLFLRGVRFGAERAREIGLVHKVVAPGTLDVTVDTYVSDLLAGGPEAIATSKALIAAVSEQPVEEAHRLTVEAIAERRASGEGQEGIRAFLEKGRPSWVRER